MSDDFLSDVIARVRNVVGEDSFPASACAALERQIRHDWAGNDVHIALLPLEQKKARDITIKADAQRGVSKRELAKKHNLRPRRIQQIINR